MAPCCGTICEPRERGFPDTENVVMELCLTDKISNFMLGQIPRSLNARCNISLITANQTPTLATLYMEKPSHSGLTRRLDRRPYRCCSVESKTYVGLGMIKLVQVTTRHQNEARDHSPQKRKS